MKRLQVLILAAGLLAGCEQATTSQDTERWLGDRARLQAMETKACAAYTDEHENEICVFAFDDGLNYALTGELTRNSR